MTPSTWLKLIAVASAIALIALLSEHSRAPVNAAQPPAPLPPFPPPTKVIPSPTPVDGGEWKDEFWGTSELSTTSSVQISVRNRLTLKAIEYLNWKQTWTAHFALGEFFQMQAISDSVQLAPIDGSGEYFTTGTYTSTVFDAGRTVDWLSANWNFSLA